MDLHLIRPRHASPWPPRTRRHTAFLPVPASVIIVCALFLLQLSLAGSALALASNGGPRRPMLERLPSSLSGNERPVRGLALGGGGMIAVTAETALLAHISKTKRQRLQTVLNDLDVIAGDSGGAWFMALLTMSQSFLDDIYDDQVLRNDTNTSAYLQAYRTKFLESTTLSPTLALEYFAGMKAWTDVTAAAMGKYASELRKGSSLDGGNTFGASLQKLYSMDFNARGHVGLSLSADERPNRTTHSQKKSAGSIFRGLKADATKVLEALHVLADRAIAAMTTVARALAKDLLPPAAGAPPSSRPGTTGFAGYEESVLQIQYRREHNSAGHAPEVCPVISGTRSPPLPPSSNLSSYGLPSSSSSSAGLANASCPKDVNFFPMLLVGDRANTNVVAEEEEEGTDNGPLVPGRRSSRRGWRTFLPSQKEARIVNTLRPIHAIGCDKDRLSDSSRPCNTTRGGAHAAAKEAATGGRHATAAAATDTSSDAGDDDDSWHNNVVAIDTSTRLTVSASPLEAATVSGSFFTFIENPDELRMFFDSLPDSWSGLRTKLETILKPVVKIVETFGVRASFNPLFVVDTATNELSIRPRGRLQPSKDLHTPRREIIGKCADGGISSNLPVPRLISHIQEEEEQGSARIVAVSIPYTRVGSHGAIFDTYDALVDPFFPHVDAGRNSNRSDQRFTDGTHLEFVNFPMVSSLIFQNDTTPDLDIGYCSGLRRGDTCDLDDANQVKYKEGSTHMRLMRWSALRTRRNQFYGVRPGLTVDLTVISLATSSMLSMMPVASIGPLRIPEFLDAHTSLFADIHAILDRNPDLRRAFEDALLSST